MSRISTICVLAVLAGSNAITANAATVHKWIDESGITHYSDAPPPARQTEVTRLEIRWQGSNKAIASNRPANYYSIANQWQRMYQERLQRMQLNLQRAALKQDSSSTQIPVQRYDSDNNRYLLAYPRRFYRRHHYPSHSRPPKPQPISLGAFPTVN